MLGPNQNDPFNQHKQIVGEQLVDRVLDELSLDDVLTLALRKWDAQEHYNHTQIGDKIREAQFWLWDGLRKGRDEAARCARDTRDQKVECNG